MNRRVSRPNDGSVRSVSRSAGVIAAVVSSSWRPPSAMPWIAPERRPTAANVVAKSLLPDCTSAVWRFKMSNRPSAPSDNGAIWPTAALRFLPCPSVPLAIEVRTTFRSLRVFASNASRIWSSSTVGWMLFEGIVPPSAMNARRAIWSFRVPNERFTNVSPTSVFVRSVARVSFGSGANFGSIFIVTRALPPSRTIFVTLPTVTPLTRTSA
ncbi:unannotated protein [freshwater metagenome]|uniref:Unannotated protein n=1 Tax=freshwater metagenome TaxID=449393 RepID=A0A6J7IC43_9ZZZZ